MTATLKAEPSRYRRFLVNTGSNIVLKFFTVTLGFILTPLFVNHMGKELYALWILNFTITNYFFIVDTSIAGGVIKHISESRSDPVRGTETQIAVINNSLAAYGLFGIGVAFLLIFGAAPLVGIFRISPANLQLAKDMLLVSGAASLALWPLLVFPSVLKGLQLYTRLNLVQGCAAFATQLTLLILVVCGCTLQMILFGYYVVSIASGLATLWVVGRAIPGISIAPRYIDRRLMGKIMGFSFGLLLLEFIAMLGFQSDKLILAYLLPVSAVASYDVVTRLFYQLRDFYGMFLGVIQPMVFEANHLNDRDFIVKLVHKAMKYVNIGYIPLIVLGMAISKPFITIWMGPDFGQYGYWSTFYLAQYLIIPVVGVMGSVAVALSKLRSLQILGVFSVTLNLIISIVMVKLIDFPGVLVGTVATSYIVLGIAYAVYCRQIGIPWQNPIRANWKICCTHIICFVIPGILLGDRLIHSWLSLCLFSLVFLAAEYVVLIFFFMEQEEKDFVRSYMCAKFSAASGPMNGAA